MIIKLQMRITCQSVVQSSIILSQKIGNGAQMANNWNHQATGGVVATCIDIELIMATTTILRKLTIERN